MGWAMGGVIALLAREQARNRDAQRSDPGRAGDGLAQDRPLWSPSVQRARRARPHRHCPARQPPLESAPGRGHPGRLREVPLNGDSACLSLPRSPSIPRRWRDPCRTQPHARVAEQEGAAYGDPRLASHAGVESDRAAFDGAITNWTRTISPTNRSIRASVRREQVPDRTPGTGPRSDPRGSLRGR